MATLDKHTRLYDKKILPLNHFKDLFLDYILKDVRGLLATIYRSPAVFDARQAVEPGVAPNTVKANGSDLKGTNGQGLIIDIHQDSGILDDFKVPPGFGELFHIGVEQNQVPDGVEVNPRTAQYEYARYQELVGRVATPDAVVDNGDGTLTITVNVLGENGWDYSGRNVRVWLTPKDDGGSGPASPVEATAIQTLAVSFAGGNNTITVPNLLGQTAASTTATDYKVMLVGATVKRQATEDLRNATGVVFLAGVYSSAAGDVIPPTSIDTSEQNVVVYSGSDFNTILTRNAQGEIKIRIVDDGVTPGTDPQIHILGPGAVDIFKLLGSGNAYFSDIVNAKSITARPHCYGGLLNYDLIIDVAGDGAVNLPHTRVYAVADGTDGVVQHNTGKIAISTYCYWDFDTQKWVRDAQIVANYKPSVLIIQGDLIEHRWKDDPTNPWADNQWDQGPIVSREGVEMKEIAATTNPAALSGRLYFKSNGIASPGHKTQLMVRWPGGTETMLAESPAT